MLIDKKLLEQLISLASDSAEYLNEKWITVKPHGADSKGTHVLVKDGETSKQAVERKFGDGDKSKSPLDGIKLEPKKEEETKPKKLTKAKEAETIIGYIKWQNNIDISKYITGKSAKGWTEFNYREMDDSAKRVIDQLRSKDKIDLIQNGYNDWILKIKDTKMVDAYNKHLSEK